MPLPFQAAYDVQHFRRGPAGNVDGAGQVERFQRARIAEFHARLSSAVKSARARAPRTRPACAA